MNNCFSLLILYREISCSILPQTSPSFKSPYWLLYITVLKGRERKRKRRKNPNTLWLLCCCLLWESFIGTNHQSGWCRQPIDHCWLEVFVASILHLPPSSILGFLTQTALRDSSLWGWKTQCTGLNNIN